MFFKINDWKLYKICQPYCERRALVSNILSEHKELPRIYLAIGTEDFLLEPNRKFHQFLINNNIEHTYIEDKGIHDWFFWDKYINKSLSWLVNE